MLTPRCMVVRRVFPSSAHEFHHQKAREALWATVSYRFTADANARSSAATVTAVGRPSGSKTQQRSTTLIIAGGTIARGGWGQGGLKPSFSLSPDEPHMGLSSVPHTKASQMRTPRLKMSDGVPYPWPPDTFKGVSDRCGGSGGD